jgi:glutamine amidotransferase
MIAIVDYGLGNLRSVEKAFHFLSAPASILSKPVPASRCSGVVLPGVGAFGEAMRNLKAAGWDGWLREAIGAGLPFLGICLGLQLLFSRSEEGGDFPGLNVLPGRVRRLPLSLTVPHMGWNQLNIAHPTPLLSGVSDGAFVYFVHSYQVVPDDPKVIAATTDYGGRFVSAVASNNVWGVQFHPEKSQSVGLRILRNFIQVSPRCNRG